MRCVKGGGDSNCSQVKKSGAEYAKIFLAILLKKRIKKQQTPKKAPSFTHLILKAQRKPTIIRLKMSSPR